MISILTTKTFRPPIVYNSSYRCSIEEIVYKLSNNYNEITNREYALVSHPSNQYSNYGQFKPYDDDYYIEAHAYGYLINPYHSKLLVFDIDGDNTKTINFIKNTFLSLQSVETLDIVVSSIDERCHPRGRHIYIGLREYYNLIPIYKLDIEGTCKGFNKLIVSKGEIVIRSSPKFFMNHVDGSTIPYWEEGYSKVGETKCLKFTQEQLIAPLISADVPSYVKTLKGPFRSLKLRG